MAGKRCVISVSALLRRGRRELLVLRRALDSRLFPGRWEPPGGKVEPHEDLGESLCREVREETGFEVQLGAVAGASDFELPDRRVIQVYFEAQAIAGELRLSPEHCEVRWASARELDTLPLTQPFARVVRAGALFRPGQDV
jgi:mutator protein MutT